MGKRCWMSLSTTAALCASIVISAGVAGCTPHPKSMFEQQAEADASSITLEPIPDDIITASSAIETDAPAPPDMTPHQRSTPFIQTTDQQAIARQPNCDHAHDACQYLELNVLSFSPKQPWLDDIMWQTIARTLAPETPLASQSQSSKNTVSVLFNQIAYSETPVSTLPMYQRIHTTLVLNPNEGGSEHAATGYLVVDSSHMQDASRKQQHYVMLDIQKQLQLSIHDILLPNVGSDDLLAVFQTAKKQWLSAQGVERQYLETWPLELSNQWYLDDQGLHMVYGTGELLAAKTAAADLVVPYTALQGIIKPQYQVADHHLKTRAPK